MKITRIDVYGYELAYAHGEYAMSGGRAAPSQSSTLVRITTDSGLEGWGEACPLGSTYLPAFAAGARAGLRELGPVLIGLDPCNLAGITQAMDAALLGHSYVKSPIDIACWDIFGQALGVPIATLLGGRLQERFPLYTAVPLGDPDAMGAYASARRSEGVHAFQVKVGGDPADDLACVRAVLEAVGDDLVIADANGGWRFQDAVIAARVLADLPGVHLEQPCRTLADCARLRALTSLPMIYDECVEDADSFVSAVRDGGAGAVNVKLGRVGGLTHAKLLRDLGHALGIKLTIEDTWGGDVATAAVSHLAASTHADALLTASFFNDWTDGHVAGYQPRSRDGFGAAPRAPGLGIHVDVSRLPAPLFSLGR